MFGNSLKWTLGGARRHGGLAAAAALALGVLSACGGSDDPTPVPAAVAPTITAQPAALTVTEGDSATFTVSASGSAPLAYQWRRGGADIAGATASTYTLTTTTLSDDGAVFTVTVSNSAGSVTSAAAVLRVNARLRPPTITAQPASMTIAELNNVTLAVTVDGTPPFAYQWQRSPDGVAYTDIAGAIFDRYTTPLLSRTDSGVRYRVIVSNATGQSVTSDAAQITVTPDAAVLLPGGGIVSGDNDNIRLEVPAGALLGPTRFRFTPLASLAGLPAEYALIPNTAYEIVHEGPGLVPNTPIRLTLRAAAQTAPASPVVRIASNGRVVRAEATPNITGVVRCQGGPNTFVPMPNGDGFILLCETQQVPGGPSGTTSVGAAQPVPAVLPSIVQQPASVSVPAGRPTSFSVVASGPALTYQWRRNGIDIPGATGSSYAIAAVSAADNGVRFSVVVRNNYGSVTSAEATLTVGPPLLPLWSDAREIAPFAVTTAYFPKVGGGTGPEFAVWTDGARLRGAGLDYAGSFAPVDTLDLPAKGAQLAVVSGPQQRLSYIVYVDDDGSGNCGQFNGNRLSAVAVSIGSEGESIPRSDRFTLYQSTGCIGSFQAGRVSAGLVFAVTDVGLSTEVRVGIAGVYFNVTSSNPFAGAWVIPPISTMVLPRAAQCSGLVSVANQGLMGVRQTWSLGASTEAVLAINAHGTNKVCTSVLTVDGTGTPQWSTAQPLFDESCNDLTTAIDGNGNALVVCNRGLSFSPPDYRMTAAYRTAASGAWDIQPLAASAREVVPHAAFDASGNAIVVWRTSADETGPARLYAARRTASTGAWSSPVAISPAGVDTRYPRLSVLANGDAMALFQMLNSENRFQVHAVAFTGGTWSEPAIVQRDPTNEGRFAEAQLSVAGNSFVKLNGGPYVVWREVDAADPTRVRLMAARRLQ
ncbi:MAG: immunoglobulin domain-containing protein [Pseudomonadota bacterium]